MSITPLPPAPQPIDSTSTFNAKAFALVAALNTFVSEANALAVAANDDALAAAASELAAAGSAAAGAISAAAAAASANAAAASAGAVAWVSGSTYALGDLVWSPITRLIYRRIVAGGGTTDPSSDATNWAVLHAIPELATAESLYLASF